MDKRNKRTDTSDLKKIDNKIDRGDLKKTYEKLSKKYTDENIQVNPKEIRDRGDSERKLTNAKSEKIKLNLVVKKSTNDEPKFKNASDSAVQKGHGNKKNNDNGTDHAPIELGLRQRIRDKYTLKLKSINKTVQSNTNLNKNEIKASDVKTDASKNADRPKKQVTDEAIQTKDKMNISSTSSGKTDIREKKPDKNPTQKVAAKRKPMIKTIMSKNGSVRIYKAVTFVDQKRSPATPLEINIPCDTTKKSKVSKFTDTNSLKVKTKTTVSRASVKERAVVRKKTDRKRDRRIRHVPSPDISVGENRSPPTEVARWAPTCIDRHTKPYYEAWVNTTLAAISKCSKKDKLYFEKQRNCILQSFQRALLEDRPQTPELIYENFADEKYTGRIKITQR